MSWQDMLISAVSEHVLGAKSKVPATPFRVNRHRQSISPPVGFPLAIRAGLGNLDSLMSGVTG